VYRLDWSVVWRNTALLTDGLMVTLELSIIALSVSVLIGIGMAYARLSPHRAVFGRRFSLRRVRAQHPAVADYVFHLFRSAGVPGDADGAPFRGARAQSVTPAPT